MNSISKMKGIDYYMNLQYYTRDGEQPCFCVGAGAKRLGLIGAVDRDVLHNLLNGFSPDGKRSLIQQQKYGGVHTGCGKARQHQLGWDITASAPKPYSVICGIGPEALRLDAQSCGVEGVKAVIQCIEADAAYSRRGQGGKRHEKAELVFIVFPHTVSRAGDPQWHYHMLCLNLAYRPSDRTWGTIESKPLYNYKMTAGAVFRGKLAQGLTRMGFKIQRAEPGFKIEGISDEVCQHFSKRRQAIQERLDELGQHTAADAERVTLETRPSKQGIPPREQLVGQWRTEAAKFGLTPQAIADLIKPDLTRKPTPAPNMQQIVDEAIEVVATRRDTFTKREVIRQALDSSVGSGTDVQKTIKRTQRTLRNPAKAILVSPEQPPHAATYTTAKIISLESALAKRLDRMMTGRSLVPSTAIVNSSIDRYSRTSNAFMDEVTFHFGQFVNAAAHKTTKKINRPLIRQQAKQTLDGEDWKLVRQLTQFPGRATVIRNRYRGDAGIQRYVALRAATRAWQKSGYQVIFASPYRRTAKALEDATSAYSITFKKLQLMMMPTFAYHAQHFAKQFVRAAFNHPTFSLDGYRVNDKRVLIVDRANQLSVNELTTLVRDVDRHGGKIVLLTPYTDDMPQFPVNLTASLLNDLAQRLPTHMGPHPERPAPKPPVQEQTPGPGIHP